MLDSFLSQFAWPRRGNGNRFGFLSLRQFEREIARERLRSSRRAVPFCVVSIKQSGASSASKTKLLARLLHLNLRSTDEKAYVSDHEFSVILVDTALSGGQTVVERLSNLIADRGVDVEMKLRLYQPSEISDERSQDLQYPNSDSSWSDGDCDGDDDQDHHSSIAITATGAARRDWSESSTLTTARCSQVDRRCFNRAHESGYENVEGTEVTFDTEPISKRRTVSSLAKRGIDIVGASVGLVFFGPPLLVAMGLIRFTSPGPAIFCQTREGLRGKPFTIFKLRTMVANAEASQAALRELSHRDGPAFKIKSDPRVTKIGKVLRATCLDELPQLVNVLRGDMSIVGPRPLPLSESLACEPWHRRRLDVRPGLTCYWQIDKDRVEDFNDWMRLDLSYVDRRNLWIDASLILKTVSVTLTGRGSH